MKKLKAVGTGLLRTMYGSYDAICDLVPVDTVVNCMIVASWHTRANRKAQNEILIYNCTTGQINMFTWGMFRMYAVNTFVKYPFENVFILPNPHFTTSK